jgi:hypothetical protein
LDRGTGPEETKEPERGGQAIGGTGAPGKMVGSGGDGRTAAVLLGGHVASLFR